MKRGNLRTGFLFLLIAFLVLLGTASLIANAPGKESKITGATISITGENTIRVPNSHQPTPNENEGTLVLWTKPAVEIFDQFSDSRDYIIFFSATNIPGLRIVYNLNTKQFEAGTPLLRSPTIDIFDGQNHQLSYTFKKGTEQAIYLDGVKVASSEFRPMALPKLTAFMVNVDSITEVDISGVEVAVYDRALTPDQIN
ncbi:MAG: LamG-like jellyroll fold domain-containing protein [Candidatus Woesearchaeota archaeon]